jgi:hypothetical protein
MLGDGRVKDPPAIVGQDDHHIQQANETEATVKISASPTTMRTAAPD